MISKPTILGPGISLIGFFVFISLFLFNTFVLASEIQDTSLFHTNDFKNPAGFAIKLRNANDSLSKYIREQLPDATQQLLDAYNESTPLSDSLQKLLVDGLNQLLLKKNLYTVDRFLQVRLSDETKELIESNPENDDFIRLNRLLLQDAYQHEIKKKQFQANSGFRDQPNIPNINMFRLRLEDLNRYAPCMLIFLVTIFILIYLILPLIIRLTNTIWANLLRKKHFLPKGFYKSYQEFVTDLTHFVFTGAAFLIAVLIALIALSDFLIYNASSLTKTAK